MSAGKVEESLCFLLQAPLFLSPSFFFLPILWIGDQEVQLLQLPATAGNKHGRKSTPSGFTPKQLHWLRTASLDRIPGLHP